MLCPRTLTKITLLAGILNSLPNNKILDWPKFKAFGDDKLNAVAKIENSFGKDRKHGGKRRKCWCPAFFLILLCFQKASFFGVVKSRDCVVKS